jgi:hypothetical protein
MKEAALRRMESPSSKPSRFKARDRLLTLLEALWLCAVPPPPRTLEHEDRRCYYAQFWTQYRPADLRVAWSTPARGPGLSRLLTWRETLLNAEWPRRHAASFPQI